MPQTNLLKEKSILIIGGSGLIGSTLVRACLEEGGRVLCASRNPDVNSFSDLSVKESDRLFYHGVDVTLPNSVDELFKFVRENERRVDAIVNCSFPRGRGFGAKFEDVNYKEFCDNISAHLGSVFQVCQSAAKYFSEVGSGNIINISSIYGVINPRFEIYEGTPMTKEVEYSVCKSAIIHLTGYLAKYLKGRDIQVNCVSPGGVYNGEPEKFVERYNAHCSKKGMLAGQDVVGTIMFLLSDHARFVNGQNLVVDDGFCL